MTGEDLVRTIGSDYQEIQKRTLTKWVNTQLQLVDDQINNIETDFKDGRKLLKLLSVVSKEPAPKPEKMNMRIHQLANVAQALSFLEKRLGADSIVDVGNEAIVNGDKKKTLALIFFIMIKYQIQVVLNDHGDDFAQSLLNYSDRQRDGLRIDTLNPTTEQTAMASSTEKGSGPATPVPGNNSLLSARKLGSNYSINSDKQHTSSAESKLALLFWVRIQLEDYIAANIIPSIQDFSRSWRNGLAFCLLIHRHGPDLIPDLFTYHLKDADLTQKQTWHRLLTLAFDLAAEHMHIPRYLESEDLVDVDYPHEPSVMMYVAEFYKVMSQLQQTIPNEQRHDIAIRRRTNIAMVTGGIDTLLSVADDSASSSEQQSNDENMDQPTDDETNTINNKKNKKKVHRISTLADEDKERIKADLNSRLMMQLTGHLPRGVNPLLDQLITIHETVLAFIKTNTRTLDEIPPSFDDADAVAEYLDALEIVEEQLQEESSLLDTARDAKDNLILPPEETDETTSIRLTDLQRTQVKNLYDMLLNHWNDFEQLLSATKSDLLRIESDMVDIEEGTHKYHIEADKVMDRIKELKQLLDKVIPYHDHDDGDDTAKIRTPWHPLDECDQDGKMEEMANTYQQAAMAANEQVDLFDSNDWKAYRRFILQFSRVVLKQVKSRLDELELGHQQLLDTNQDVLVSSKDFARALELVSTATAIGLELESIHKLMDDNNHTTNDAILDLENQVNAVRTSIYTTREAYDDLLLKDERLAECISKVQQQYEMVRDWVDQVRVWFIEAERIRRWIEERIDIIHQRNQSADFDPLCDTLTKAVQENSKVWHEEHVKLGREIERFNADDMTRLRTHVKTLTGADRGDRDLSPADTSTIEITLTTLNMLNQLMHLQRERSYMVDMLMLRIHWDNLFDASSQWILETDGDMTSFLKPGQARWISSDDDSGGSSNSSSVDSSFDDISNVNRRWPLGRSSSTSTANVIDTKEMIHTLVALETKVIQFDQSTYSDCLDAYQEMEDLQNATLPAHLDIKQSQFEASFGDLMKRSGFTRKVVEQHLALLDIATQYRQLRDKGEGIRIAMINSSKSASTNSSAIFDSGNNGGDGNDTDSDSDIYGDQVQTFKEESSQLITYGFSRIMYTEPPAYTTLVVGAHDKQDNELANNYIKEKIQGYAMQLATIAEALENLLASHRRALSLQQRATLAYEEMMRLIQWLDERRKSYKKSWLNGIDNEDDGENEELVDLATTMEKYQRELDGMLVRMEQLEEGDLSRLQKRVSAIEDEIDASNAISIDRSTLINAIEDLDSSYMHLRQCLEKRSIELVIMRKRKVWEDQVVDASGALDGVARSLWALLNYFGTMHIDLSGGDDEGKEDNDDGGATMEKLEQQRNLMESLEDLPPLSQSGSYGELEKAYQQLGTSLPALLVEKRQSLIAKQHDLGQLYLFVQDSAKYRQALKDMVDETKVITRRGDNVYNDLVKLFTPGVETSAEETGSNESSSTGLGLLVEFKQLVDSITGKRKEIQAPTNSSTIFDSLRGSLIADGEGTEQVNKWLDSKHGDLHSLIKTLEQMESRHTIMMKAKSDITQYLDEANSQLEWIEKQLGLLKTSHLDLADDSITVTEEDISRHAQYITRLQGDTTTFKESHVNPLKLQATKLYTTGKPEDGAHGIDTKLLGELLDKVGTGMDHLEQQASMESLTLEMIQDYLGWNVDLQQVTNQIGVIQEQIHPLVSDLKEKSMQDDLTIVDFGACDNMSISIDAQLKSADQAVKNVRTRFTNDLSPFIRKQLPASSANKVCDRLETKLVGMERSFGRCQNNLQAKIQDIAGLKEQQKWQHQVNEALNDLDDLGIEVNSFVEGKARWYPGIVISENDETDLRNTWAAIKANLDNYHQHNLSTLQQEVQTWGSAKRNGDNDRACEWTAHIITALTEAYNHVENDLVFGNEIINQRCLMATFLWRTTQLEQSAEVIREEFLDQSRSPDDATDDNAQGKGDMDWLADHGERLQRFNSGIDDIRQEIVPTIPLPVRSLPSSSSLLAGYSKSKLSSAQKVSGVKDETTNAIITETIDTRLERLQELSNGLRSLLDSKERMSRLEMSRVLYINQVETCESWINAHMDKLQTAANGQYDGESGSNNNMVDIQQLRGAIGIAESIEAATQGNDTVLASLQSAYNTYKGTLSSDTGDGDDTCLDDYIRMENKWQLLQQTAKETTTRLLGALDSAEMNNHINHLQETIHQLQGDIATMDFTLLTDDHITQWQKQIDALDKINYNAVTRMMTALDNKLGNDSLQQRLDQVGETILSTRNTLARLYDVVNLNRLYKTYGDNAVVVKTMIDDAQGVLLEIQQTYGQVGDEATIHDYRDSLLDAYQETKLKISDCKEAYDDLCAYNSFIQTQKVGGGECDNLLSDMDATQETVDASWKLLQTQGQVVSNLATMASRLAQGYEMLAKVEQNAQVIQTNLANLHPSPSMDMVTSLQKKIRDDTAAEMAEALNLMNSLENRSTAFGERYQQVVAMVDGLQHELDQHKRQLERGKLLQSFADEVTRIQLVCEEQLKFIRQQVLANPDLVGKRPESINHISQTYVAAINNIEKVHEKCKDDYQVVLNQSKQLVDYYDVPSLQLETIKRPLCKALQDLDSATQTEFEYIAALRVVMKHAKMEVELTRSISDMKATLLKYSKQVLRSRLNALPDLADFNRRNDDLANSVQLFFSMGNDFKKSKLYKSIGVARTSSINKAVEYCQGIIRRMWPDIKTMMDDTKVRLDEMYRRQHGSNKLNEALRYVDDIKDRINTLQLSGKSVTVEEDELKELDREIKVTLAEKIQEMDILLASISDSDGLIRKQRAQLSTATDQLYHLMQIRQEQAQTEGNITLFLGIIDQVDEQILQVMVAIENSAPHHAKVIQGKFVKTDLQELLRHLVDIYKTNGPRINKLLGSAKEEARKQFVDDNHRVAKRLEKTVDRWTKAQASAAAREKELHTCINALNHEFFTKLALAKRKTSSPANHNKKSGHGTTRSSTPVGDSSSQSSSSSSSLGSLPPPLGHTTTRRPSFQSSTSSAERRLTGNTVRRSKTPNAPSSKPPSTYVSDPKNELDVQLGRIVNDSAFNVSVKMVSGEVGKYYFGDRLVYCRILSSKMVMVRVGGGWVELSQFLKDHGHKNSISHTSIQGDQSGDTMSPLARSASPSGRVTIRGGGSISSSSLNPNHSHSKSSNRSRSPVPSGYKEGDTFIHVGEDGHQVVMKMTKAKEDATTPIKRFS
ncbi:hypothetical protein BC941DRAFT_447310 [Chlamydoabsidia padenii]|nr:hypothetical protein BC941DRAFT_447310 [Chlamydoabsidia padenii]